MLRVRLSNQSCLSNNRKAAVGSDHQEVVFADREFLELRVVELRIFEVGWIDDTVDDIGDS